MSKASVELASMSIKQRLGYLQWSATRKFAVSQTFTPVMSPISGAFVANAESLGEMKCELSTTLKKWISAAQKKSIYWGIPVNNLVSFKRLNEKLQDTSCYEQLVTQTLMGFQPCRQSTCKLLCVWHMVNTPLRSCTS